MKLGKQGRYETHPAADTFSLMTGDELEQLAADIKANGQHEDVWLDGEGAVLDGRNRVIACELAGVEPRTKVYKPKDLGDALRFVWSLNGQRRHSNGWHLAVAATRLATLAKGQRKAKKSGTRADLTQREAADLTGSSERSVRLAQQIQRGAAPELLAALDAGEITPAAAAPLAKLPKDKQLEALGQIKDGQPITGPAARELTRAAAANDSGPPDPVVLLLRAIQGGVQRAGATVQQLDAHGLRLGFRGRAFVVQVLDGADAVRPSRSA